MGKDLSPSWIEEGETRFKWWRRAEETVSYRIGLYNPPSSLSLVVSAKNERAGKLKGKAAEMRFEHTM